MSIWKVVLLSYGQGWEHWWCGSSDLLWMHSLLSAICSSAQTSSSNGAVWKCSQKQVVTSSHASVRNGSMVGMMWWQKLWCTGDEMSSSLGVGLLASVLKGGLHHSLDLSGLSSLELVNTRWWCVSLWHLSVRWQLCMLIWRGRWLTKVCWIEGEIIHHGDLVDSQGSGEWGWDAEVCTATVITFILLCDLYFKCIIWRVVTKQQKSISSGRFHICCVWSL